MSKLRQDLQTEVDAARSEHARAAKQLHEAKSAVEKAERAEQAARSRFETLQAAAGKIMAVTPEAKPPHRSHQVHAAPVKPEKA